MYTENVINPDDYRKPIANDGKLIISLGTSRYDKSWKNSTMRWSVLLSRLEKSKETPETHADFLRMPKREQDNLKDIGGFVGGIIKGGRRLQTAVEARQILTLDADFATTDFWDRLMGLTLDDLDCAMAVYSTHKHCEAKPRLRLIIPLSREVTPDEYEAVMRKVAEMVGMEFFDSSTYEPHRLMYWPSHSSDVKPVFRYYDAPFLDPDSILRKYHDWADVTEWPMSAAEMETRKRKAEKVEDPLEKKGVVGIFCRTYTISAAIRKFLPDVYAPTGKEDRWTYTGGSTFGGLVVYDDDRLAYSHHSTDPASGRDLNAFDLVRVHKFEHLDEKTGDDVPMNRRPSWKAMTDLIGDDADCQHTRDAEAAEEFGEKLDDGDWRQKLLRNDNLTLRNALVNATLILENDEELQGIRLNLLSGRVEASAVPWSDELAPWSDTQDAILTDWIARKYGVEFTTARIRMAVSKVTFERRYHPIRDYLDSLPAWDGIPRVDTLLIRYLDAEDNAFTREAIRKTLVAAVARIFEPGCKFDQMLDLIGAQGAGKSTFFRILAGDEWFSDSLKMDTMASIKDAGEQLQGKWIVEIGEMSGMRKADVEIVKSFISRQVDSYRAAYAHYTEDRPRQCVIVGSTNQFDGFLRDTSGNRRFWPVMIRRKRAGDDIFVTLRAERDQIWAEAKAMYEQGESFLLSDSAAAIAADAQREAMEQDDRQGIIEEYLGRLLPEHWDMLDVDQRLLFLDSSDEGTIRRTEVSNIEIWAEAMRKNPTAMEAKDSYAIAKIMAKIPGWVRSEKTKRLPAYGRQRLYLMDTSAGEPSIVEQHKEQHEQDF